MRTLSYDMFDFDGQCVASYLEWAQKEKSSLREVPTPLLDESVAWEPPDGEPTGALAQVALKVLMNILYVRHVARPDLLRATCMLARKFSQWCKECDRRLHRLGFVI